MCQIRASFIWIALTVLAVAAVAATPAIAQFAMPEEGTQQEADEGEPAAEAAAPEGEQAPEEGEAPPAAEQPAEEGDEEAAAEEQLEPIAPNFDFEGAELAPHWSATGMEAALKISREPGAAMAGQGALVLSYMPAEGNLPSITVAPIRPEVQPQSLRFGLKLDEISSIRYAVREEDGTEYEGYCYAPADEWVDVRVPLSELMLAQGSEDENGALDGDQIVAISITDLCNLPGEIGRALGVKRGMQQMHVDNLQLSATPAPARSWRAAEGVVVDHFNGNAGIFLPVGAPEVDFVAGPPGDDTACQLTYSLGGHRWVGLVRGVGHLDLTGAGELSLMLSADQPARMVAVLEEWDGSKYETNLTLNPEAGWTEIRLPIEQFILDAATTDENRVVDLDQVRVVILVIDTFNASVDAMGEGRIKIARLMFR